eukprot:SAG31_NODE_14018_length_831_cov_1.465847_1_plen_49_part_10
MVRDVLIRILLQKLRQLRLEALAALTTAATEPEPEVQREPNMPTDSPAS